MTDKEVGRLTLRTFNKLYQHYKDDFDMETRMRKANLTYEEVKKQAQKAEEWL